MGGQRHATEIGLKSTGQVHHATRHGGPGGEQKYLSTLSLTTALDFGWVVNATPQR